MTRESRLHIAAAIVVPIALLLALIAWGVASPPGASPDEDYHMGSIWCAGGLQEGVCEEGTDADHRELPGDLVKIASCFAFNAAQSADCPLPTEEMRPTIRGNWLDNGYPPVFYAVMSTFVGTDLSTAVVAMRVFNAILYVSLLTTLFLLLPVRRRPVLVWGALISLVPLGMFLIPSVNPSSWAILQATGLWLAVWGYFERSGWRKVALAVLAVVLMLMGSGARSDSAVYGALAVLIAVALAFRRNRRFALESILAAGLIALAIAMFFTAGQSGIVTGSEESDTSTLGLLVANLQLLPQLWVGAFGLWGLGWLDTNMPGLVWITTSVIFGALVFWGLRFGDWRKWLATAAVAGAVVAVPLYILVRQGILVGTGVQPRYIYPLLIMLGAVALVRVAGPGLGLNRLQLVIVGAGLSVANSLALHINLRRYITGTDHPGMNLDRDIEWWWNSAVSPMTVWILGSLAFAVALIALITLAWPRTRVREQQSIDRVADADRG